MTWKLYEGDCLEIMPDLPDISIDMILTDLPYGTTANKWDSIIPLKLLWDQFNRIIKVKGAIILTASQPFTTKLIYSNYELFKYEWIWIKNKGTNFFNVNYQPLKVHENILVFGKGATSPTKHNNTMNYNPILEDGSYYSYKRTNTRYKFHSKNVEYEIESNKRFPKSILNYKREDGLHPNQKPTALFEYLIKTYTMEGDTVLDSCAGSGTTGVACYNTGRDCIMIEKEPNYCNIIKKRMAEVISQTKLNT
jgi:site-specific DNA-methyltransferase (adenine-specific)